MTRTEAYTRMHRAMAGAAREFRTVPHVARVLLAVHEVGGRDGLTTDALYGALGVPDGKHNSEGTMVRRSLGVAYETGLALGTAPDGTPRRQGLNTLVRLTDDGRDLVERVLDEVVL